MKRPSMFVQLNANNSEIDVLKKWSGYDNYHIIFDSDIDGDVSLKNVINNKDKLCFIHFERNGNVFGGFIHNTVNVLMFTHDPKCFVFSLIRNGIVNNKMYVIKEDKCKNVFLLRSDVDYVSYMFGSTSSDIVVSGIHSDKSFCYPNIFNYRDDKHPLIQSLPYMFSLDKIIIVQMD